MNDDSQITRIGPDSEAWYLVAVASGEAEAAILAGLLKANDIPVWIYQEAAGRALGLGVGALGTVEIMTPAAYYEDALALLAEDEDAPLLDEGDDNTIYPEADDDQPLT